MRYAVHQVLVERACKSLFLCDSGSRRSCSVQYRRLIIYDSIDQFFRLIDTCGYRCLIYLFACKTIKLDLLISCDDNAFCVSDLFCRKNVLCSYGALSLCLQAESHGFCLFLKRFRSHIGMGDTSRACCDSYDIRKSVVCRCFSCLCSLRLAFCLVNYCQEFVGCLCLTKRVSKVIIHQHSGKTSQNLKMYITLCIRSSDQENQI